MAALVGWLSTEATRSLTGRYQAVETGRLAAVLGQASAEAIATDDKQTLTKLAHEFVGPDSLQFVTFFDKDGQVIAGADVDGSRLRETLAEGVMVDSGGALGVPEFVPQSRGNPPYLDVTHPVHRLLEVDRDADGDVKPDSSRLELLGYVRLAVNMEQSLSALAAARDLATGIGIFVVIITVPLSFIIVRRTVEPINELAATTQEFAKGNLRARSEVERDDEIGQLARAFNHMADMHERNHKQLVALNTELEERVQDRTRQLRELASREPLTGLYNRRHFNEVLLRRYAEARRYDSPLSCLMIDLDNFKEINDSFGHHVGDELLVLVALTIASQLRAADVAARFGGDEFVVLLPQTTSQRAEVLGRRVSEKLTAEVGEQLPDVTLSLSIGISSVPEVDSSDPQDLIKSADEALYQAKTAGKNRIVCAAGQT